MISKRIAGRIDKKSSAKDALYYGAGLKVDRSTGLYIDKSHRTRLEGFELVENGVYTNKSNVEMKELIDLAAIEMQTNCSLNIKVSEDNKIAHFVVSFNQDRPVEVVLRDTEDSMLAALKLDKNHFGSFLHSDNGHWHLHIFASRISRGSSHLGNSLWRDRKIRDFVCREIEIRHRLKCDSGLHEIDADGQIVEIPLSERKARRNRDSKWVGESAKKFEKQAGIQSFQRWCQEVRIGDRFKNVNSWDELHQAAIACGCEIKPRGAGYVISPVNEKGGIQLSKVGLKNIQHKLGKFEPAKPGGIRINEKPVLKYLPEPTLPSNSLFEKWKLECTNHKYTKASLLADFRKTITGKRLEIRNKQNKELSEVRAMLTGGNRKFSTAVVKMRHAAVLTKFSQETRAMRSALYKEMNSTAPGRTFREYLVQQAQAGDEEAMSLVRQHGVNEATTVFMQFEREKFNIVATLSGLQSNQVFALSIKYKIENNGTLIFDLGNGRVVTDSVISQQIQLNNAASCDPESIETALRFAKSRFGSTLALTGSDEFKRRAVEIAVRRGLSITFSDPVLEQYKFDFSEKIFKSGIAKEKSNVRSAEKNTNQGKSSPDGGDSLYQLPERDLVSESTGNQVLLQSDVQNDLAKRIGEGVQGQRNRLRRTDTERSAHSSDSASTPSTTRESHIGAVLANKDSKMER